MASKTSTPEPRVESMAAFAAKLAARRAELGEPELARNAGGNRTESKKALLKAIDKAAAQNGFEW
jgi:hypothetical protein